MKHAEKIRVTALTNPPGVTPEQAILVLGIAGLALLVFGAVSAFAGNPFAPGLVSAGIFSLTASVGWFIGNSNKPTSR